MKLRSPSSLLVVVVVVVVQILLEPAALAACTTTDHCVPKQPDCTSCTSGDMVPDPEDCRGYYLCTGSGASDYLTPAADCGDGMVFDPINLDCVLGDGCILCPVVCQYDCTTATSSGNPYLSSHTDCSQYYECSGGSIIATLFCDASTPFFDGHTCQTEETRCCRCQPSCDVSPKSAIDPLDCRKYWNCLTTDPPTISGVCAAGKVFDPDLGECSATATCVTACTNVVNTDGCIDPFTCLLTGFFAKCPKDCVQEYYPCAEVTWPEYQEPELCNTGTVFHPDIHLCVNEGDCPY